MKKNTTRATVVIGATMALVMAGTAVVSAAPGQRDDRRMPGGQGKAGIGAQMGGKMMPGARGGLRGGPGGLRGLAEDVERSERTLQTADGVTVMRVEQGAVDSAAPDSLTFSLGSGESVTVVIDDDTQVVGYEETERTVRGWSRIVQAPTEIDAADIEAGVDVFVWSGSEDGEDFVASRIVVQPVDEAEAEADETEEAEADETGEETVTDDAAATDA